VKIARLPREEKRLEGSRGRALAVAVVLVVTAPCGAYGFVVGAAGLNL
jgi:hypothetical protein